MGRFLDLRVVDWSSDQSEVFRCQSCTHLRAKTQELPDFAPEQTAVPCVHTST